jgi:hypothetical protein
MLVITQFHSKTHSPYNIKFKNKTLPWGYQSSQCWGRSEEPRTLLPVASALSQVSHRLHKFKHTL